MLISSWLHLKKKINIIRNVNPKAIKKKQQSLGLMHDILFICSLQNIKMDRVVITLS